MTLNIRPIELKDNAAVSKIVRDGLEEVENKIYHDLAWSPFLILSSYVISLALFWIFNYSTPLIGFLGPIIVGIILAIRLTYLEKFVINPGAKIYNEDLLNMYSYYNKEGHYLLVAEINNKVVGSGGFTFEGPNTIKLKRLFFSAEVRRKGIGSQLIQVLIKKAKELQVKQILLETSKWQMSAVKFYTRHGFQIIQIKTFMNIHLFPGFKFTQFLMERFI